MSRIKKPIALVARSEEQRAALALYLTNAGFTVHPCEDLDVPNAFHALVLVGEETLDDTLLGRVRSWLKATKTQRMIVVTPKPAAFKTLATVFDRLFVLPAPVFGWEIVDILRDERRPGPRFA